MDRRQFLRRAGLTAAAIGVAGCGSEDGGSAADGPAEATEDVIGGTTVPGTGTSVPGGGGLDSFDHIVVLMFENRSFDNVLGGLYGSPGNPDPRFDGIFTAGAPGTRTNPGPDGTSTVAAALATDGLWPLTDPGECYADINVQLFGQWLPASNRGLDGCPGASDSMTAPYNVPDDPQAAMAGFVADYASAWQVVTGQDPTEAEYAQIMSYFDAQTLPNTWTLAQQFGVFDAWFCDVPSDTFVNRSFFHAAASSGLVTEPPYSPWPLENTAETILRRMGGQGVSWKVYYDPWQAVPTTLLISFRDLWDQVGSFHHMTTFFDDAAAGTLPQYSFIEPRMLTVDPSAAPPNDMHPTFFKEFGRYVQDDIRQGDALLGQVYEAIRTSPQRDRTLLLVVFDEHGGLHDHVPPPTATPPDDTPGAQGFGFDRLGVRIPAIAISSFVEPGTIVSDQMQNTSVIATLSEKWGLGTLTARDASAPRFDAVLNATAPREWPALPSTSAPPAAPVPDQPLAAPLARAITASALAAAAAAPRLAAGDDPSTLADSIEAPTLGAELSIDEMKGHLESAAGALGLS